MRNLPASSVTNGQKLALSRSTFFDAATVTLLGVTPDEDQVERIFIASNGHGPALICLVVSG